MHTGLAVAPSRCQLCPPSADAAVAAPPAIRVLHIEDHAEEALLVQEYLSGEPDSFSVEWVSTLREGLHRLREPGIDIVLLDLGMPELRGHRTHSAVRAAAPLAPVVILTSDDRPLSRELALLGGASGYLVKEEVSPEDIREALRQAVRSNRPDRRRGTRC